VTDLPRVSGTRRTWFCAAAVAGVIACPSLASAKAEPAPLVPLPLDKVINLAPLLRSADAALIELTDKGRIKQLTTLSLAAAPPDVVREVVAHPERYGEFVRNMDESRIKPDADGGTFVHHYRVSYKFETVEGRHRYVFLPPVAGHGAAPIDMYDPDDNGVRHYRWEFLPAGGGTLIVLYGYTQIPLGGLLEDVMKRAPTLEFGLALIPQWTLLLAVKQRAEQLAGRKPVAGPAGNPNFNFLLQRGTVALFRASGGVLQEVDLIDHVNAPPDVALKVAGEPRKWKEFMPSVSASIDLGTMKDGLQGVEIEQSIPLITWNTKFEVRATPVNASGAGAVDMLGVEGDLRLGRLRWDASPIAGGKSQLVLRTDQPFEHGSMVLRQLYKQEPLFKYGVNIGFALLALRSIEQRAEAVARERAGR
jgi:hypothetical protein